MSGKGNGHAPVEKKKKESAGKKELNLNPFSTPRFYCVNPHSPLSLIVRVLGPSLTFNKRL